MAYRYVIVLDRYDDEEDALCQHGGDEQKAREQVAAELQEAMNLVGEPAGFFNVVSRFEVPIEERVTQTSIDAQRASIRENI